MPISVSSQAYVFLWTIAGGMIVGLIFDIFRLTRKIIKYNNILTFVEDIIYWVAVALILFYILYKTNDGQLRGFVFVGILIGAVLYFLAFSPLIMKVSTAVINFVGSMIKWVLNFLLLPIKIIVNILSKPAKAVWKKTAHGMRRVRYTAKDKVRSCTHFIRRLKIMRKKM